MPRGKEAEVRKLEIIEQFYQVIVEEGLEKASLAKIAKRLSVSPSLLIHHFKNKDEMVLQLIDFIVMKYTETISNMIDNETDPDKRIRSVLDLIYSPEWTKTIDDKVYIACLHISNQNSKVKKRLQQMYSNFITMLEEELQRYADAHPELIIEVQKLSRLVVSLQEGLDIFKDMFPDDQHFHDLGSYVKPIILSQLKV